MLDSPEAIDLSRGTDGRRPLAERVRVACLQAALDAYEQAGIAGLCGEGRWELAVQAIRALDLEPLVEWSIAESRAAMGEADGTE